MNLDAQSAVRSWMAQEGTVAVIVLQEYPQRVAGVRDYRILARSAADNHTMTWMECAFDGEPAPAWWQVIKHAFRDMKEPTP